MTIKESLKSKTILYPLIVIFLPIWIVIGYILASIPLFDIFILPGWIGIGTFAIPLVVIGLLHGFEYKTGAKQFVIGLILTPFIWVAFFMGSARYNSYIHERAVSDFVIAIKNTETVPNNYDLQGSIPDDLIVEVAKGYSISGFDELFGTYWFTLEIEGGINYSIEIGQKDFFSDEWDFYIYER